VLWDLSCSALLLQFDSKLFCFGLLCSVGQWKHIDRAEQGRAEQTRKAWKTHCNTEIVQSRADQSWKPKKTLTLKSFGTRRPGRAKQSRANLVINGNSKSAQSRADQTWATLKSVETHNIGNTNHNRKPRKPKNQLKLTIQAKQSRAEQITQHWKTLKQKETDNLQTAGQRRADQKTFKSMETRSMGNA
jgi:hypothetical protein